MLVNDPPFVDIQNATTPSKPLIRGSKVGCSETELTQRARTHDAWLDGHVQVGFEQRVRRDGGGSKGGSSKDFIDCLKLSMSSGLVSVRLVPYRSETAEVTYITKFISPVPRACYDLATPNKNTADGYLVRLHSFFSLDDVQKGLKIATLNLGQQVLTMLSASRIHFTWTGSCLFVDTYSNMKCLDKFK
jgi:hypothetical protein